MTWQPRFWVYTRKNGKQDWNRYVHTRVYSSLIHNHQNVETAPYPQTAQWVDTVRSIHTLGYHPASGRRDVLPPATTWMDTRCVR